MNSGMVKYFTASKAEVSIRQEPIKHARYVFKCSPPINDRMGIKNKKKKRHSGNMCRIIAIIILESVLAETSKKH